MGITEAVTLTLINTLCLRLRLAHPHTMGSPMVTTARWMSRIWFRGRGGAGARQVVGVNMGGSIHLAAVTEIMAEVEGEVAEEAGIIDQSES